MSALKGDFISFSFNKVHSSDLGIIRTSDGSRFNENLLPTIQDKTIQVPGGDGTYFFGSYYTQRPFSVPIAFDSLTEEQVRRLYSHFGDKQIHELIFDERPYKYYMAKINGTPQIKIICFEEDGKRIYKGEGNLNFICYYPFAKSRFKYLDQYNTTNIPEWNEWPGAVVDGGLYEPGILEDAVAGNKSEWALASGMKETQGSYDGVGGNTTLLYNAGDLPTDFKVYLRNLSSTRGVLSLSNTTGEQLIVNGIELKQGDLGVCVNTKTNLIEGYNGNGLTGTLYNSYIVGGDFFKLPLGEHTLSTFGIIEKIEYDYLYY